MIRPIATEIGLFLTPFVLYAAYLVGDACRRFASEGMDVVAACRSRHRVPGIDDRKLSDAGAVRARAAGLYLCAGAYRGRQVRAAIEPVTAAPLLRDVAWLKGGDVARLLALLDRDGEEARVVGGAVRNALIAASGRRDRHGDHGACRRRSSAASSGRRQGDSDRHRARHNYRHHRSSPGRGHDVARGRRNLRPQGPRRVRPRLAGGRATPRLYHQRALGHGRRDGARLCRRPRRHRGASRALYRRAAAADRGRLSAHPAVLSLSRPFRRGRAGPAGVHACIRAPRRLGDAVARTRAHGDAEAPARRRARRRRSR